MHPKVVISSFHRLTLLFLLIQEFQPEAILMFYTRRRAYVVYPGYLPVEVYEPNGLKTFIAINLSGNTNHNIRSITP
ncbi:hypothetical protein EDB82DRAFT_502607 [Fusarium venenatum]|uniref:uncharacterized protein n=1 Tax=Fusarium venenatum TaxID=56646 RepID=UPI001D6D2663|nr:hypothetical protein EDB82DRAFT_502607 [Fusarium venenatum]